jgi:hypothetical protein
MEDILISQFDLACDENNLMFESAQRKLEINIAELTTLHNRGYFTESESEEDIYGEAVSDFAAAVKKFFANLMENIRKLISETMDSISENIKNREVHAKLKNYKKAMADNKSLARKGKISYFDTIGYIRAYNKYINFFIEDHRKLYSKEYKTSADYKSALAASDARCEAKAKELGLANDERWTLDDNVEVLLVYTENEVNSINSIVKAYQNEWENSVKEMANLASHTDNQTIIGDMRVRANALCFLCRGALRKTKRSIDEKIAAIGDMIATATEHD